MSLGESGSFNPSALGSSIAKEVDTEKVTKRNHSVLCKISEYSNQVSLLKYLVAIANSDGKRTWIRFFLLCYCSAFPQTEAKSFILNGIGDNLY